MSSVDDPIRKLFGLKANEYYNINRDKLSVVDNKTQELIRAFIKEHLDDLINYGKVDCIIDNKPAFVLLVKTPMNQNNLLSKVESKFSNALKVKMLLGYTLVYADIPNDFVSILDPNRGYFVYGTYRESVNESTGTVSRSIIVKAMFRAEEFATPEQQATQESTSASTDINALSNLFK